MVKKITSGQVVERRKSYVGRKPSRRGARIKGNSGEKKQENNRQQAVLALARLLNCNYTHGDALLTLTFIDEALERCGGTFEGAVKEAKNFLDRIARRMKKHGDILKWVLVPSEVDGETGETVRLHCHIVINSAGLRMEDRTFTLYGEPLDDTWGRGTVDVQLLRDQKDYYPLALYLIRQARNIAAGHTIRAGAGRQFRALHTQRERPGAEDRRAKGDGRGLRRRGGRGGGSMKKLRGVRVSRNMQGFIRFTCLTYDQQPKRMQNKIDRLLRECGGPYDAALREVMCGEDSITAIALRHFASESSLYRMRKNFYESWEVKRK